MHWGIPALVLGVGLGVALSELSAAEPAVLVGVWCVASVAALASRRSGVWVLALVCAGSAVGAVRADAVSARWSTAPASWA